MSNDQVISASPADIIIIGAGPGGYRAAEYAAEQGLKVVIIEQAEVGGTCLNVGCIPTKAYVHSTSFAEARERMATVVPLLRQGVETILSHPNITLVRDRASLVDTHTVACSACGDTITARNIIIATGSETKWLPIKGKDDPRVVDSTGLLNLDTLPKRLAIIGAGVIGMEFASVFHRFGSEVTVIEFLKECLPALDSDIAKRLRKYLEKQGINFKMKTAVEDIADIDADVILMATGRKPRTEGLGLETLGIMFEKNGAIPVDDHFRVVSGSLTDGQSVALQSERVVINSGGKSERFVKTMYPDLPQQAFVEYGNYIGDTLKIANELGIKNITLGVMLGKAVKLAAGNLDTHSRKTTMDKAFVQQMLQEAGISIDISDMTLARELWERIPECGRIPFAHVVIHHCYEHCAPLLPNGELTILLIDDNGKIYEV